MTSIGDPITILDSSDQSRTEMNPFAKHLSNVYLSVLQIVMNISSALVRFFSLKELIDPLSAEYNALFTLPFFDFILLSFVFCLLAIIHKQLKSNTILTLFLAAAFVVCMPVSAGAATSIIFVATKHVFCSDNKMLAAKNYFLIIF